MAGVNKVLMAMILTSAFSAVLVQATDAIQLTSSPFDDYDPAWSPDGTIIVFLSNRVNPQDGYDLFAVNTDGTNERELAYFTVTDPWGGRFGDPSWFGMVGDLLVMDHKYYWEVMRFYISQITHLPITRDVWDGDSPFCTRLLFVPGGQGTYSPVSSKNGSILAWAALVDNWARVPPENRNYEVRIYKGTLDSFIGNTNEVGQVIFKTGPGGFIEGSKSLAFSPDGTKLCIAAAVRGWTQGEGRDLYIVDLVTGENRRLTWTGEYGMDNAEVSWSVNNVIAFTCKPKSGGTRDLYLIFPDGTGLTQLTNTPWDEATPCWSPDGAYLSFASNREGNWDIFVIKISAGPSPTQGYIKGQVKDASTGQGIQAATVEASGPITSSTPTDSNGNYTLSLPSGTYTLTASASGYHSQTKTGVEITAGQTLTVDFALSPITLTIIRTEPTEPEVTFAKEKLTIVGTGFVPNPQVVFYHGDNRYIVNETDVSYISAEKIEVSFALFDSGTWTIEVKNPTGASTTHTFNVRPWTFAVITDIHMGRGKAFPADESCYLLYDDVYHLLQRLRTVVDTINVSIQSKNIKFVVVLGDISDDGDITDLQQAKETLDQLAVPYFPILGNHDGEQGEFFFNASNFFATFNANFLKAQCDKLKVGESQNTIANNYYNYSVSYKGIEFLFLDCIPRNRTQGPVFANAHLHEETRDFIENEIKKAPSSTPFILFSHNPIINDRVAALDEDAVKELANILSGVKLIANFAGHVHGFYDPKKPFHVVEERENWLATAFSPVFFNANYLYPPDISNMPAITTEALMVGSNSGQNDPPFVRLVEVKGTSYQEQIGNIKIDYISINQPLFPETVSLNPYFKEIDQEFPPFGKITVEFELYAFNKLASEAKPITYRLKILDDIGELVCETFVISTTWNKPVEAKLDLEGDKWYTAILEVTWDGKKEVLPVRMYVRKPL